jgi:nitrite reductase (NO-forming)
MAAADGERHADVAVTAPPGESARDAGAASSAAVPSDPAALRGKVAFESKCALCHTIGGGNKVGPDLRGVTKLLGNAWIERWLRDPAPMLASDPHAKAQLAKYRVPMPKPDLSNDETRDVLAYLSWADATLPGSAPAPSHDHAGHQHGMK